MRGPSLRRRVGWISLLAGMLSCTSNDTWASDPETPWLLGDWNGSRTRLRKSGIDLQLGYTGELAYNATGGNRREVAYADQYTAGATVDLDRLLGLHDAKFQFTLTARTGRNLSDDAALGTLQEVQEIFGRGQTVRLTQFWYDQKFLAGTLDWKIGRMTFNEDFASFPCNFENLTFCGAAPGNLVPGYIYNWPVSQWATRLRYDVERHGYLQVGVYDVNAQYAGAYDPVLPVFFPGSTGLLIPVELAWLPAFGGAFPGSYKLGGWYDTSAADDVVSDINGNPSAITGLPPRRQQGRFGAYLSVVQQLTALPEGRAKDGMSAFLNVVTASDRSSTTDAQAAAGVIYTGPFRSRPDDDIGFAIGTTRVNGRIGGAQVLQNSLGLGPVAVQGAEFAMEVHYTFRPVGGLLLRPSLQYVINPGGTDQHADVLVLGFTTSINF